LKEKYKKMYIDISLIFMPLVHNIATMPYSELVQTELMLTFVSYVNHNHKFKIKFDRAKVKKFETVDELFYESREYFQKNTDEYKWIDLAIQKMQTYVNETNLVDLFTPLQL